MTTISRKWSTYNGTEGVYHISVYGSFYPECTDMELWLLPRIGVFVRCCLGSLVLKLLMFYPVILTKVCFAGIVR